MEIFGSCLCGQIEYKITGSIHMINNCHCSMCRKVHGAAFGSFMHMDGEGFEWLSGAHLITSYQAPNQDDRCFCSNCGSSMPMIEEDGNVIIPAGTLDTDPGIVPLMHIFTGSKAPWHEITDSLPQFREFPPEGWVEKALANPRSNQSQ